ncbi:hypothetical protein B0T19DRAFT_251064 [Cercophora scortea]|uniref:Uncharacterized protein n=1 Tax=Cercophora scortea TaxID=314031 RepID=A0AAE0IAT1_9PEZI|nr:hypothetical protein B0T19DRAFT_251064 [Cercophora scortea]
MTTSSSVCRLDTATLACVCQRDTDGTGCRPPGFQLASLLARLNHPFFFFFFFFFPTFHFSQSSSSLSRSGHTWLFVFNMIIIGSKPACSITSLLAFISRTDLHAGGAKREHTIAHTILHGLGGIHTAAAAAAHPGAQHCMRCTCMRIGYILAFAFLHPWIGSDTEKCLGLGQRLHKSVDSDDDTPSFFHFFGGNKAPLFFDTHLPILSLMMDMVLA